MLPAHPEGAPLSGAPLSNFSHIMCCWKGLLRTLQLVATSGDQWSLTAAACMQTVIWLLLLVRAWELFAFFHGCRSLPPAAIKRALCERGCEEGGEKLTRPQTGGQGLAKAAQEYFSSSCFSQIIIKRAFVRPFTCPKKREIFNWIGRVSCFLVWKYLNIKT